MNDGVAKAIMEEIRKGVDDTNERIDRFGAKAYYPEHVLISVGKDRTLDYTLDFSEWITTGRILRTRMYDKDGC